MRSLHLPPVSQELRTFVPAPKPAVSGGDADAEDDDDEGIKYVDKLEVIGGVLGTVLKASGEFVGTPTMQWSRRQTRRGSPTFVDIAGATTLEYTPTADDVNTVLRLECQVRAFTA